MFAPSSIFKEWSSSFKKSLLDNELDANNSSRFSYVYFAVSSIALHNTPSMRCCSIHPLASSFWSSHFASVLVFGFFLLAKTKLRPCCLKTCFILLCPSVKFSLLVNFNSTFVLDTCCGVFIWELSPTSSLSPAIVNTPPLLKLLIRELSFPTEDTMKLYCNNQSAIKIADNPVQHDIMKHVKIDRNFIYEKLEG
ncbi:unnamed protein product [Prunus brigantina]